MYFIWPMIFKIHITSKRHLKKGNFYIKIQISSSFHKLGWCYNTRPMVSRGTNKLERSSSWLPLLGEACSLQFTRVYISSITFCMPIVSHLSNLPRSYEHKNFETIFHLRLQQRYLHGYFIITILGSQHGTKGVPTFLTTSKSTKGGPIQQQL